jgi:hypothetical protein
MKGETHGSSRRREQKGRGVMIGAPTRILSPQGTIIYATCFIVCYTFLRAMCVEPWLSPQRIFSGPLTVELVANGRVAAVSPDCHHLMMTVYPAPSFCGTERVDALNVRIVVTKDNGFPRSRGITNAHGIDGTILRYKTTDSKSSAMNALALTIACATLSLGYLCGVRYRNHLNAKRCRTTQEPEKL